MRMLRTLPPLAMLAALILGSNVSGQEKKPVAEKHDAQALADALREVINTGADLFNKYGDYAGCYRIYQGGLLSIKPFLTSDLQKKVDHAIAKAESLPKFSDRAFELRALLGEIRDKSMGKSAAAAKQEAVDSKKDGNKAVANPSLGQVSGKVTYEGKPAPPGFITLIGASQRFSASITDDGSYGFRTPIPPGRYKIVIDRVPGAKIPPNLDIPERYRNEATAGLTFDVQRGKNIIDLVLKK